MGADPLEQELPARHPALRRLGKSLRQRRIPWVRQMTATECGAACLAMVLGYHGKDVRIDQIRELTGVGRDGLTALALLQAGQTLGLRGRGIRLEPNDFQYLQAGAILHWEFNHFVVFERARKGGIDIVDPAMGRRHIPLAQVRKSFTGIGLVLEPMETFEPGAAGGRPIWRQFRSILARSDAWARILFVSLMLQVFALALPLLTGAVVDRVVPRADVHLLLVVGSGLGAIVLFHFLASLIRGHLLLNLRAQLDTRMAVGFLDHMLQLPYVFFQRRRAGDLLMRLNSNTTIREILASGLLSGVLDGTLVLVYLILLILVEPRIAVLALALAAAQLAILFLARGPQRELLSKALESQSAQESNLVEMLAGIETLKAMGAERRAGEQWSSLFVDEMNVTLERGRLAALVDALSTTVRLASPLVLLVYGATHVLDGSMTLGTMLAVTALAQAFLLPLSSLVGSASQLQLLSSYLDRIEDVLQAKPEQERKPRPAPALRGRITLDRVSFHYHPSAPAVVDGVSVDIAPGSLVAIVGASGSGKSTLANLLLGLYRPTSGRVLYDAVDLAELDLPSVRRQLGIVTQRSYLFGATIRANIALSDPGLPLEAVADAAGRACIHADIAAMPMGYDTLLIDGGASLSGGQRQRVALARALVHDPAILLLDEATSALDAITERNVQQQLARLGCTRVVIAHRLSTIKDADLILVMDNGRIVEHGRHAALLTAGGHYARLLAAQVAP